MLKTLWWCLLILSIVISGNGQDDGANPLDSQVGISDSVGDEVTDDGSNESTEITSDLSPPAPDGVLPTAISEAEMIKILEKYNKDAAEVCNTVTKANWNAATDVGNKEKEEQKVREKSFKFSMSNHLGHTIKKKKKYQITVNLSHHIYMNNCKFSESNTLTLSRFVDNTCSILFCVFLN